MSCNRELNFEYHETFKCITSALDAGDHYAGDHSRRVSRSIFAEMRSRKISG